MHVHNVIHSDSRAPCCLHNTSRDLSSYWSARLLSNFSLLVRRMVVIAQSLDLTNPTRSQNQTKERRIVGSFPRFSVLFELFENPAPPPLRTKPQDFFFHPSRWCMWSLNSFQKIDWLRIDCVLERSSSGQFFCSVCLCLGLFQLLVVQSFVYRILPDTPSIYLRPDDPIDQSVEKGRDKKKKDQTNTS